MEPGSTPASGTQEGAPAERPTATLYELVGGEGAGDAWFAALVDRFYDGVTADPVLRPLYPEDLTESRALLVGFLVQYWGGPSTYSAERGHPRLRMRHAPFAIGDPERAAWLRHMTDAVRAADLPDDVEASVLEYFEMAARHLVNR